MKKNKTSRTKLDEAFLLEGATHVAKRAISDYGTDLVQSLKDGDAKKFTQELMAMLSSAFMSGAIGLYMMEQEARADFSQLKTLDTYKSAKSRYSDAIKKSFEDPPSSS